MNAESITPAEKALWMDHQLDPTKSAYNLARAFRTEDALPASAVARAFRALALRHRPLCSRFPAHEELPVREFLTEPSIEFVEYDATGWSEEALASKVSEEAHRPFALETGPLWRITLFRESSGTVLLFCMHHLLGDMQSLTAIAAQLGTALTGELIPCQAKAISPAGEPTAPLSDRDFSRWKRHEEFWLRQLAPPLPSLELPNDFPAPSTRSGRGRMLRSALSSYLCREVAALARGISTTPFAVLLAGYSALLFRWTRQQDLVVGCPVSRQRGVADEISGYVVNPLPLRLRVDPGRDFGGLVKDAHMTLLSCLRHGNVPFLRLLELATPQGQARPAELFRTMIVLYRGLDKDNFGACIAEIEKETFWLGSLECHPFPLERYACLMSLRLEVVETGGTYHLRWEYATDLFSDETIRSLAASFAVLMRAALAAPGTPVDALPLLDAVEERRITRELNRTAVAFPPVRTIHEVIEEQSQKTPDRIAVVFEGLSLTYRELSFRSNQLAWRLAAAGIQRGSFVGILLERSPETIVAMLAVLKARAAFVPLDPSGPAQRLDSFIAAAQLQLILGRPQHATGVIAVPLIEVDAMGAWSEPGGAADLSVEPTESAYLIFTSGSSGNPKGVVITHSGIYNRLMWMQAEYPLNSTDAVLQKTPFTFDVSVWEVFWPLMTGAKMVLARPGGHRDPAYLAQLIRRERVTTLHFVPSMLREFLDQPELADLPSVRRIFSSGEELTRDLADRCMRRFDVPLHNLYGPTEASVDVSYHRCELAPDLRRVPIGRPIANTQLYVLDAKMRPVPAGMPGELYIGGDGLARGYANQASLTASRFVPNPFDGHSGGRLYRTGDLTRQRVDGAIEYIGRIDTQTKIAGVRIELEEIEAAAMRHPNVRIAVAHVARRNGPRLCCYFVPHEDPAPSPAELREFLSSLLLRAMVPSWFVRLSSIPLTPSGKLARKLLPEPEAFEEPTLPRASADPLEQLLVSLCCDVLGRPDTNPRRSFMEEGGHSLDAVRVISRLEAKTGIALPIETLLGNLSLSGVAAAMAGIQSPISGRPPLLMLKPRPTAAPLSYEQERLWILDQLLPGSTAYNVDYALQIDGPVEPILVERALRAVLNRHEILRTTFGYSPEGPVQHIQAEAALDFQHEDLTDLPRDVADARIRSEARTLAKTPFDLGRLPLARFRLVRFGVTRHVLLVSMHHIVTDGWSLGPLISDFRTAYGAVHAGHEPELPPAAIQYADYSVWQRGWMSGGALQARLAYWKRRLSGLSAMGIPSTRPRPAIQSFDGHEQRMQLSPDIILRLEAVAREAGATMFMALLAAFTILVHRYSGETDLAIATPVANRNHPGLEDSVGFFVNTLVLRLDISGNPGFKEFLRRVRERALEGFVHGDVPFEKVIEALHPERDLSRPPLFQTLFVFQNTPTPPDGVLRFTPLHFDSGNVRYDLRVSIEPQPDGLDAVFQYNSDLFEPDFIAKMMGHFDTLLRALATDPAQTVSTLPLLTSDEVQYWGDEWNRTETKFPDVRLETLFLRQVERNPDALAVLSGGTELSYGDVSAWSAAVATGIANAGIFPGELIAVVMEKGWEQVVAVIGVLRAGCAYLPIDPGVPPKRMAHLISDGQARLVLTQSRAGEGFVWPDGVATIEVDRLTPCSSAIPAQDDRSALAYVIYTSGSTGSPKGVMIDHRGAINTILEINRRYQVGPGDSVLALSSLSFDLSVWDIFGALAAGATIVMPQPSLLSDPRHWYEMLHEHGITIWNSVPILMEMLLESASLASANSLTGLRVVLLSGDWIPVRLPDRIRAVAPLARIVSLGGATEASIWSIVFEIGVTDPAWKSIPYGRPIANQKIFVLDSQFQICPVGVTGSIYIGGAGLAQGYWRDPAKTRYSFPSHPLTGERLYRTGDLGRYRLDGNVELLGREDAQVKIGGSRIEPGEVEAVATTHPSVRNCVVTARGRGSERHLVLYAVAHAERPVEPAELVGFLRERLPHYMVPSVTIVDRLPVNSNGKVDTNALPEITETAPLTGRKPALGSLEWTIGSVLASALQVPIVDCERTFFDQGATSLSLVRARRTLEERLRRELPMVDFFLYPTAAALAAHLEAGQTTQAASLRGRTRAEMRRAAEAQRDPSKQTAPPKVP